MKYRYDIRGNLLEVRDPYNRKVLEQFSVNNENKNSGIEYNGCIYKAYLYIAEDNSYFQWSIGCVELLKESIGEYAVIFTFKLINGTYRLKQIHGID